MVDWWGVRSFIYFSRFKIRVYFYIEQKMVVSEDEAKVRAIEHRRIGFRFTLIGSPLAKLLLFPLS
jgi:hypothetical protein